MDDGWVVAGGREVYHRYKLNFFFFLIDIISLSLLCRYVCVCVFSPLPLFYFFAGPESVVRVSLSSLLHCCHHISFINYFK